MKNLKFLGSLSIILSCNAIDITDTCITESPGLRANVFNGSSLSANNVVFTIDGGSLTNSQAIADVLFSNNINGLFFLRGRDFINDEGQVQTIVKQNHQIGNGSFTGESLERSKTPVLEVRQTDFLVSPYVNNNAFLFSAPLGIFNERLASYLNRAGLNKYTGPIGFSHPTRDLDCWIQDTSVEQCADTIFQEIENTQKGIVRISSEDPRSIQLSQTLIALFRNSGYSFATVTDASEIAASLASNGSLLDGDPVETCDDYD